MRRLISLGLVLMSSISLFAQEGYPIPKVQDILFYIQHNRGKNTYIYQTNKNSIGQIDKNEPVKVSRQLFDNKGEIKSLSAIQRKFAYGIEGEQINATTYELSLVSYPAQKLYLHISKEIHPYVETTVNGVHMKINRLFIVQKKGTSGINTKVDYILFMGTNKQGNNVQSKLIPN